jgi:hypothetical protein
MSPKQEEVDLQSSPDQQNSTGSPQVESKSPNSEHKKSGKRGRKKKESPQKIQNEEKS